MLAIIKNFYLYKIHSLVHACMCAQSCPALCSPMDCSPDGSSVHETFQATILEWVAISCSTGSSWPRDRTQVSNISCTGKQTLYHWATWEATFTYTLVPNVADSIMPALYSYNFRACSPKSPLSAHTFLSLRIFSGDWSQLCQPGLSGWMCWGTNCPPP